MIRFKHLSKEHKGVTVLSDISLDIHQGEFVTITGPSGAGKSSLISVLIGESKPTSGTVSIDDLSIGDLDFDTRQLYRRKIGIVFQDYKLLPQKTVEENIAFAMEVSDVPSHVCEKRVEELLLQTGLSDRRKHYSHQLSGGEQQRVAIARALAHKPKLIIADEPTGNLDRKTSFMIVDLLKQLHKGGATVILTTHDVEILQRLDERLVKLENGKLIYDGKVKREILL